MIRRVDHIGIVVKDLHRALDIYAKGFDLQPLEFRELDDVPLKVAVFQLGDLFIELLEYGEPGSEAAKILRGNQPGLNHVCYEVDRLDESMKTLTQTGFQAVPGFPRKGIHGQIAFLLSPPPCAELIEILERGPLSPGRRKLASTSSP